MRVVLSPEKETARELNLASLSDGGGGAGVERRARREAPATLEPKKGAASGTRGRMTATLAVMLIICETGRAGSIPVCDQTSACDRLLPYCNFALPRRPPLLCSVSEAPVGCWTTDSRQSTRVASSVRHVQPIVNTVGEVVVTGETYLV